MSAGFVTQLDFNGYTIPGNRIQSITGLDYPETRVSEYTYPGRDGGYYADTLYGQRKIAVEWLVLEADMAAYLSERNEIMDAFDAKDGENTLSIQINSADDYQVTGIARKVDLPARAAPATYVVARVELVCNNPFILGQTEETQSTGVTTLGGGGAIPAVIPMSLSGATNLNPTFTNDGNTESDVVWTIYGPGTDFTIQNLTTGESFTLETTLSAGTYIEVNTNLKTVKQGGFTNVIDSFTGDFLKLDAGDNVLSFTVGSGSTSETLLLGTWRNSWVGL